MSNMQVLNNATHQNLHLPKKYAGDLKVGAMMVIPDEISDLQREFPIVLRKDSETGKFFPNVLLGFEQGSNLFLSDDTDTGWSSRCLPLVARKGPFMIGFDNTTGDPLVYIDIDDPRLTESGGENLYEADGSLTPFMHGVCDALRLLHEGYGKIEDMVSMFLEFELIEPVSLQVTFKNGEELNFGGAYTVAIEKLEGLSPEQLGRLHESGFLPHAYYIADSISNVRVLIDLKEANVSAS